MSKADEMFEKLEYKKQWVEDENEMELYKKEYFDKDFIEIVFDKTHYLLNIRTENISQYKTITSILNIKELQAINEKMKELGWNE
jgi:hypothetical protein